MFLRPHQGSKDGKDHTYWWLVETVRTASGPRQTTPCYLGELNGSAQAGWLKSVEVFNEQGEAQQLNLVGTPRRQMKRLGAELLKEKEKAIRERFSTRVGGGS